MEYNGPKWISGDNWIICQRSGFKIRVSDARLTWDNKWVRKDFWEPRQPQDFVTGRVDKIKADVSNPEQEDVFLSANQITSDDL